MDCTEVARRIRQAFPALPAFAGLELLGEGFSSYAIWLDNDLVFRIAKHPEVTRRYRLENYLLPRLREHLPIEIPQPLWFADKSDGFPFGIIGYELITGTPFNQRLKAQVDLDRVAQDLAQFLLALHRCQLEFEEVFEIDQAMVLDRLWAGIEPALRSFLSGEQIVKFQTWWDSFLTYAKNDVAVSLVHGDPWSENLLLNSSLDRLVGVIDFETVSIGDVARDFAPQRYLGAGFQQSVIEHYERLGGVIGNNFYDRLRDESILRELRGLQYALRTSDTGEIVDARRKIDELVIWL